MIVWTLTNYHTGEELAEGEARDRAHMVRQIRGRGFTVNPDDLDPVGGGIVRKKTARMSGDFALVSAFDWDEVVREDIDHLPDIDDATVREILDWRAPMTDHPVIIDPPGGSTLSVDGGRRVVGR